MNRKTNIREIDVKPGDGKDVDSTQMLKGQGSLTPAQTATNKTSDYTTSTAPHGKLGGKPSRT